MAMRRAGRLAARTLREVHRRLQIGVTTAEIDAWVRHHTFRHGGVPAQFGYGGFPASVCTSRNHVACHGIPRRDERLASGDIISVDVTTRLAGFHGDTCATFAVGRASPEARHLIAVARRCRDVGIGAVRCGVRLGDIGAAVEALAHREGCRIVREFGGHGIGRAMHQPPHIDHYGRPGRGLRLKRGMAITIEPIVTLGDGHIEVQDDGWTAVARDGALCAQFEHTLIVTARGAVVTTEVSAATDSVG